MIKNSFRTVFSHPIIPLSLLVSTAIVVVCAMPMMLIMPNMPIHFYSPMMPLLMILSFFLYFAGILSLMFLVMPVIYNYVYEVCSGSARPGWIKRGIKRNWWKISVTGIVMSIPVYVIYLLLFGLMISLSLLSAGLDVIIPVAVGFLILFMFFYSALVNIGYVSVTAEDKYEIGLKNIFKVGLRILPRAALANLLLLLPSVLLTGIIYLLSDFNGSVFISRASSAESLIMIIVLAVFSIAVSIVLSSFIIVYINMLFIKKRAEVYPDEPAGAAVTEK
ncbi:MAG: hypothetical protein JXN65_03215 [Clostridia bacterium]|nr:hypothetical protein [Clostridia bacterium]